MPVNLAQYKRTDNGYLQLGFKKAYAHETFFEMFDKNSKYSQPQEIFKMSIKCLISEFSDIFYRSQIKLSANSF